MPLLSERVSQCVSCGVIDACMDMTKCDVCNLLCCDMCVVIEEKEPIWEAKARCKDCAGGTVAVILRGANHAT